MLSYLLNYTLRKRWDILSLLVTRKSGKNAELKELIKGHLAILIKENLATTRPPYVMQAADGTYLEVFEWVSKEAVESAHNNPAVLKMWADFSAVSDYRNLSQLSEASDLFAHFQPIDL